MDESGPTAAYARRSDTPHSPALGQSLSRSRRSSTSTARNRRHRPRRARRPSTPRAIHPKPKPQLPTDSPSLAARAWPLTHCVSEQIVDLLRTDLPYKAGHGQPNDCTRADVQATQLGVRPLLTQILLRPGVKANRCRPQLTGWRHRHPLGAGRCGGTTTTPVGLVVGNREQLRLRLVSLAGDDPLPRTRICGWFGMARRRGLAAYPLALLLHLVEANVSRHGTTSPHQQPLVGQPRCARSALAQVADRT